MQSVAPSEHSWAELLLYSLPFIQFCLRQALGGPVGVPEPKGMVHSQRLYLNHPHTLVHKQHQIWGEGHGLGAQPACV